MESALQIAGEAGNVSCQATCLDILIDVLRSQGDLSKVALLEQQRDLLPKDEFPPELFKELEQAFSSEDPETMVSAVRECFGNQCIKKASQR